MLFETSKCQVYKYLNQKLINATNKIIRKQWPVIAGLYVFAENIVQMEGKVPCYAVTG